MGNKLLNLFVLLVISIALMFALVEPVEAERTVPTKSERGSIFVYPYNDDWKGMGAVVFGALNDVFTKMSPDGLKVKHARFHHFNTWDETGGHTGFPYSKLIALNNSEIAAGRPPVMVTATYQGKTRYVYAAWGYPSGNNFQLADVADDRFIDFFVNEYVRKIAYPGQTTLGPADWIGSDNGMFSPSNYGVFDDSGNFVRFGSSGLVMNDPFWKTPAEYYEDIATFFRKIKAKYPDVKIMVNMGSMGDWSKFEYVYKDIHGIMHEDLFASMDLSSINRDTLYDWWNRTKWFAQQNKVALLRVRDIPDNQDVVRTAYIGYLMVRGDNFFHCLQSATTKKEINPQIFQDIRNKIGDPIGEFQSEQESGRSRGYRLYQRQTTKGMIYMNFTGSTKTISLPTDKTYFDRNGNRVTSITIPDSRGDFVSFEGSPRPTQTPSSTPQIKLGDANGDGRVDGLDYVIWVDNYGISSGASVSQGDFNRDGKIDGLDYVIWVDNYLV